MANVGSRLGRVREVTREWIARAGAAAPHALPWVAALIGAALAVAIGVAAVLIAVRAGEAISLAFLGSAPFLGRALGYLLMAVMLAAGVALFFIALTAVVRFTSWALTSILTLTAKRSSAQSERYVVAALLALLPAAAAYVVATQDAFLALPLELKQYLAPILLPLAVGAAAAPAWGSGRALTLTVMALLAVAAIVVAVGYLSPAAVGASALAPGPLAAVWHWTELMRQSSALQRLWWMLLVLLAVVTWSIIVFAGSRMRDF